MTTAATTTKPKLGGGISFGGIAKPVEKKGKTSYPVLTDESGVIANLVNVILECEEAKDRADTAKKQLAALAEPQYFTRWHGHHEQESSMKALGTEGNALVTFSKRLKKITSADTLTPLADIFDGHESEFFRERFSMEIDGDAIPLDQQQAIVDGLQALFAQHGCSAALSVATEIKALEAFHTTRHVTFTPAQNERINAVLPIVVSVKTKGVS